MRIFVFLVATLFAGLAGAAPGAGQPAFRQALPGYSYQFPRDLYVHDDFRIEWWYYTGNLEAAGDRRFGYQLTFFRVGLDPEAARRSASRWAVGQVYFAHLTVTDIDGGRFHFFERINRKGLGQAGAESGRLRVWNEDWELTQEDGGGHRLIAREKGVGLDLQLSPLKPPVIHGRDGISRKGSEPGNASHYVSYTRMATRGTLSLDGQDFPVTGTSWMDREFSSNQLSPAHAGWDWFSLKLDSGEELMLYQIRLKAGGVEALSSGTWIPATGPARHLSLEEYRIESRQDWVSGHTGARYPARWRIRVPDGEVDLEVVPELADQELYHLRSIGSSYWEGSVRIRGTVAGREVAGRGYVELVGYSKDLSQDLP